MIAGLQAECGEMASAAVSGKAAVLPLLLLLLLFFLRSCVIAGLQAECGEMASAAISGTAAVQLGSVAVCP